MPCFSARPERGRTCGLVAGGRAMARPVGTRRARARARGSTGASTAASRSMPGGAGGGVGGQRQALAMGQARRDGDRSRRHAKRLGDARASRRGHLVLGQLRPVPRARLRSIRCTSLSSPPMMPVPGATSLATIQSQFLRAPLGLGVRPAVVGLGGEADHQARAVRARRRRWWPGCRGCRTSSSGAAPRRAPSSASAPAASATRQSATAAAQTATSAGSAAWQAASISRGGLDIGATVTPAGSGERDRAADQRHPRAQRGQRRGDGMALLAAASGWRCSAPGRSARGSGRW